MSLFLRIASALVVAEGLRTYGQAAHNTKRVKGGRNNEAYTFDEFARDFGRAYEQGSEEYARRSVLFQASLSQIHAKNSHGMRSWTAGLNPFMDWTSAERSERLHGYKSSASHRTVTPLAALQTSGKTTAIDRFYGGADDSFEAATPAVQDQDRDGQCGSCWAFAAVEAVEAQLMKMHSPLLPAGEPRLSVQALLDCVPKESTCDGGCKGSSAENAFDFMQEHGVPLEGDLPYNPRHTGRCPIEPYPLDWVRVTLTGWRALPSNQAQPLMQAIVQDGPATATADAHKWYDYYSGVFDDCPKNALPNHNVLVRGYGAEDGAKYWLVQNSWGTRWGENGAIRLARQDDADSWCGVDSEKDGYGCDGDTHMNVTVCGTCGLLYNAVVPQVGYVLVGPGPDTKELAQQMEQTTPEHESHVKARRSESDIEELAQQMESSPSSDGGAGGKEAQQLEQAAKRVQSGEQQLARQLGRTGVARTEEEGSEEMPEKQPRFAKRRLWAQRKRDVDDEELMQAALGDERGKAHAQTFSWPPPLAREEAPERREQSVVARAKAESASADEEEQALELESAASAGADDESEKGSEAGEFPMLPPLLNAQGIAHVLASKRETNDRSTAEHQASPAHDTTASVPVRSRAIPSEEEKPQDMNSVNNGEELWRQDEEPQVLEKRDSTTSLSSNTQSEAARPQANDDVVNVLPSQKEARALYARVQDRFSPTGSLDGFLRR